MHDWNEYLLQRGAHFCADRPAEVAHFGRATDNSGLTAGFVAPLSDLGLIAASGADAADFLHKQLSNDVLHLGQTEVRLAGYCTPKGRLLATMLMWRNDTTIHLQLPREILPAIQKRLHMFVMRAKVSLADASADPANAALVTLGLGGAKAQTVLTAWFPDLPPTPYSKQDNAHGTLLRVADAYGAPRYQWLMAQDTALAVWPILEQSLAPVGNSAWRLSEIEAGIPRIGLATQEKFVPQMINFELLGGVNFKKGCYPGQEIVARSQYLGKLKRRTMLASVITNTANAEASAVKAGMEVFSSTDPDQPCGMIVNAEPEAVKTVAATEAVRTLCLVEIKTAAVDGGTVHLGSAGGPVLTFAELPYSLEALDL
jgi:folate-binding protein YgfZ